MLSIVAGHDARLACRPVRRLALDPSTDPADHRFTHDVRTRFAETDAMGVIHHSAYPVFLEEARISALRSTGRPYESVRADGIDIAVLELFVAYRKPLFFDELVRIHMSFGELTTATFQIAYLLTVGSEVRATAVTVHGCVEPQGHAGARAGVAARAGLGRLIQGSRVDATSSAKASPAAAVSGPGQGGSGRPSTLAMGCTSRVLDVRNASSAPARRVERQVLLDRVGQSRAAARG